MGGATESPGQGETNAPSRHRRHWIRWTALGLVVGFLAGVTIWSRHVEPGAPGPFYATPRPLPRGPAGTVIRREPLGQRVRGGHAVRVLYLTTDAANRKTASSGVIFVPNGTAPPGGRPVVAWSHPTTGVQPNCAPSLRSDVAATVPGLATFLHRGYVVVATDYPGLGTPAPTQYLVGRSEARALIDSVRATRTLKGVGAGKRYAVWGHSQGGQSSLFAGEIAATYAPELTLVGVAAAAPASDLAVQLKRDLPKVTGRLLGPMALWSWARTYPNARLDAIVKSNKTRLVDRIAHGCIESKQEGLALLPAIVLLGADFVKAPLDRTEPWKSLLRDNTPTGSGITAPLIMTQGSKDNVVWPDVNVDWASKACSAGHVVDFVLLDDVGHHTIAFDTASQVAAWIDARFQGAAPVNRCGDLPAVTAPRGNRPAPRDLGEFATPVTTGDR